MLHTDIEQLAPEMQPLVREAMAEMNADSRLHAIGVTSVAVSETLRELSVQMAYYSRGRMQVEDVKAMYKAAGLYSVSSVEALEPITWTLRSNHLGGHAVDLVPTIKEIPWWRAPQEVWNIMGEIGEKHGLSWGGRYPDRKKDSPHFEKGV
jgi:hypothetical protein